MKRPKILYAVISVHVFLGTWGIIVTYSLKTGMSSLGIGFLGFFIMLHFISTIGIFMRHRWSRIMSRALMVLHGLFGFLGVLKSIVAFNLLWLILSSVICFLCLRLSRVLAKDQSVLDYFIGSQDQIKIDE